MKSPSKEQLDKRANVMFAIAGGLVLCVGGMYLLSKPEKVDRRTGCPDQIHRETVIVLDRSSEVSSQTLTDMNERIRHILDEKTKTGERITFYEVNEDAYQKLQPIKLNSRSLDFCKPKDKADSILTENDQLMRNRYRKRIDSLLSNEIVFSKRNESKSPIAQVVFDITLSSLFQGTGKRISLYVFSDLMENSQSLSLYGCSDGENAIQRYRMARSGREKRPKFRNISNFELHLVPTKQPEEVVRCRDLFWSWFLGDFEFDSELSKPEIKFLPLPG